MTMPSKKIVAMTITHFAQYSIVLTVHTVQSVHCTVHDSIKKVRYVQYILLQYTVRLVHCTILSVQYVYT